MGAFQVFVHMLRDFFGTWCPKCQLPHPARRGHGRVP
jgi:thiol-disulfide isomerase/thioredoxin